MTGFFIIMGLLFLGNMLADAIKAHSERVANVSSIVYFRFPTLEHARQECQNTFRRLGMEDAVCSFIGDEYRLVITRSQDGNVRWELDSTSASGFAGIDGQACLAIQLKEHDPRLWLFFSELICSPNLFRMEEIPQEFPKVYTYHEKIS